MVVTVLPVFAVAVATALLTYLLTRSPFVARIATAEAVAGHSRSRPGKRTRS
jgi:hypothetical protein